MNTQSGTGLSFRHLPALIEGRLKRLLSKTACPGQNVRLGKFFKKWVSCLRFYPANPHRL